MTSMKKVIFVLAVSASSMMMASVSAQADMALKFIGTADGGDLSQLAQDLMEDTGVVVSEDFDCFELPVFDLESGNPVGIGVDCLYVFDGDNSGAKIEAITFFFLPRGSLVSHGCTSARRFWPGVGDSGVTHMTGSIGPAELGGDNPPAAGTPCESTGGIVYATKGMSKFSDGAARLSGAVNLSNAGAGEITFSCLFVLSE